MKISHPDRVSREEIKLSIDAGESFKLFGKIRLGRQFEWPNRLKVLCDLCSAGSISPSGFHFGIFLLVGPYVFLERDKNKVGVRGRSLTQLRYQLPFVTS